MNQRQTHADATAQLEEVMESLLDQAVQATTQVSRQYIPKMELTRGQQRSLPDVRRRLLEEAQLAGESFYYGWGAGKDSIEGPSVKLAMAAVRCWGNCSVEAVPMQETVDAYVFTSRFLDFETGYTLERQFRQSKRWTVYGKMDTERKDDIRFQIGQSKAARNVVLNALPQWLIDQALDMAKEGVRTKIQQYITKNGKAAAIERVMRGLLKCGVSEEQVCNKIGIAKPEALDMDALVMLNGCLKAIQDGSDTAQSIFEEQPADKPATAKPKSVDEFKSKAKPDTPPDAPESSQTGAETKQAQLDPNEPPTPQEAAERYIAKIAKRRSKGGIDEDLEAAMKEIHSLPANDDEKMAAQRLVVEASDRRTDEISGKESGGLFPQE